MNIALIIFGSLLTLASVGSAFAKLAKVPSVMESMQSVGVKSNQIPVLALLEIAGGIGLIVGIWNRSLGILSSICLSLYFLGAFSSHLRKKHGVSEFGPAFALFLISIVVSFLELNR